MRNSISWLATFIKYEKSISNLIFVTASFKYTYIYQMLIFRIHQIGLTEARCNKLMEYPDNRHILSNKKSNIVSSSKNKSLFVANVTNDMFFTFKSIEIDNALWEMKRILFQKRNDEINNEYVTARVLVLVETIKRTLRHSANW